MLVLAVGSFLFYLTFQSLISTLVLGSVITIAYISGLRIEKCQSPAGKKLWLFGGIALILAALIYFKYGSFIYNLYITNLIQENTSTGTSSYLAVIGISYFTFQAISYIVDIYLGVSTAEANPLALFLYFGFFAKVLQGPIERGKSFLTQIRGRENFEYSMVLSGFLLFMYGLVKKILIADNMASFVDPIFDSASTQSGSQLLAAINFYSLQIYFDFSGYTDMALGVARLFNIRLTDNFHNPYFATSIADFWRRWHISLSRWLMDYLFKPIQMKFRNLKQYSTIIAVFITFAICGLWHGAALHYIVWGCLHGIVMILGIMTQPFRADLATQFKRLNKRFITVWRIFITYNIVTFLWIFFRSKSLVAALDNFKAIFFRFELGSLDLSFFNGSVFIAAWIILIIEYLNWPQRFIQLFSNQKLTFFKHFSYAFIYYAIILFLFIIMYSFTINTNQPFIYVQF